MWAAALRSWTIEKLHLKIIAGRAAQGAEHKSNGFFLQMCEDEAKGTDVLLSDRGQNILAKKGAAFAEGSAELRQSPEACQDASITGEAGREGRGRQRRALQKLQAASSTAHLKLTLALLAISWQLLQSYPGNNRLGFEAHFLHF